MGKIWDLLMSSKIDLENIRNLLKSESFDAAKYMDNKHDLTHVQSSMCAEYFRKAPTIESLEENSNCSYQQTLTHQIN
jgi:hypothetical protein